MNVGSKKGRKNGKAEVAALLSIILGVQMAHPAFAQLSLDRERTEEEWSVLRDNILTWEEIPDLVHEYNPSVVNSWMEFNEQSKEGAYNIDFTDALAAIEETYQNAVDAAATEAEAAIAEYQYLTSRTASRLDNTIQTSDREAARLLVEQQEATTASQLRQMLIRTKTNALSIESARLNASWNESQYLYQQRRRAAGVATDIDVLEAKESMESSALAVTNAEVQEKQNRQSLLVNLGWKYDAVVEVGGIPEVSDEAIAAVDPETDVQTALAENYTLQINRRKLTVTESDSGKASLEEAIRNGEEAVKSDVASKYNSLMQSVDNFASQKLSLENTRQSLAQAQNGRIAGTVSQHDLDRAEYQYKSGELQCKQSEYSLLASYYTYQDAIHGTASAS